MSININKLNDICAKWEIPECLKDELIGGHQGDEVLYPAQSWCVHEITTAVEEKNFYHNIVKIYSWDAIEKGLLEKSLLGIAYKHLCVDDEIDEIWLPAAKDIFDVHSRIVREFIDAGVVFGKESLELLEHKE